MEERNNEKVYFGFWVYLMTDLLMFAVLFATFAVLRGNTFGGAKERDLINLPFVLIETMLLLASSFTMGMAVLSAQKKKIHQVIDLLGLTFILGASFLGMELYEFHKLIAEGHSFQSSASLSSFFTLVGTHGLHIASGLLWMGLIIAFLFKRGLTESLTRKITLLSLFWHFLDIVWIFIFTVVYLMGAAL